MFGFTCVNWIKLAKSTCFTNLKGINMPLRPLGKYVTCMTVLLCTIVGLFDLSAGNTGLLTSSLQTFHEASCDGESMSMSCPEGMLISIQFAQYGRQVPSSEMCPPSFQGDDPKSWSQRSYAARQVALWEDTNCLATTSLKVILDRCQDQQKCHLVASTKTFQQDPCPGTRKYLEVAYKCRPDEFTTETVCEGDQLQIRCSKTTRIAVLSAMFGRTAAGDKKCPELLRNTSSLQTTCQSHTAAEEMMKLCHGKKTCTVDAEEYVFGDPCPMGVNKYLNVIYTCVPKRVLKPLRRHKHRKRKKKKPGISTEKEFNSSHAIPSSSTLLYKILPRTTKSPVSVDRFYPADAAQQNSPDPKYGESRVKSQSSKGQSNSNNNKDSSTLKTDRDKEVKLAGKTTPCPPNLTVANTGDIRGPSATGLLTDWLNAFNFIRENKEKAVLYLVLGVLFGLICLLFLVIIRLAITNKRKSRAKLDVSEPVHEDHPGPSNHIEAPTLERSDSVDRIEVVRFNPTRSRDFATCTLRSDIGNRSLTNYYG